MFSMESRLTALHPSSLICRSVGVTFILFTFVVTADDVKLVTGVRKITEDQSQETATEHKSNSDSDETQLPLQTISQTITTSRRKRRQHKTRRDKTCHDMAWRGMTRQDRARQGKARQHETAQHKTRPLLGLGGPWWSLTLDPWLLFSLDPSPLKNP